MSLLSKARAWSLLRAEVHGRENGQCARCNHPVPLDRGEAHHRQLRSRGGKDDAWNVIFLCSGCHLWAHTNVASSTEAGYLCPGWEDPEGWPVQTWTGEWLQPSPIGWLASAKRVEQDTP